MSARSETGVTSFPDVGSFTTTCGGKSDVCAFRLLVADGFIFELVVEDLEVRDHRMYRFLSYL